MAAGFAVIKKLLIINVTLGLQGNGRHGAHRFHRVLAGGGFPGKHDGAGAIINSVCHIGCFGAGGALVLLAAFLAGAAFFAAAFLAGVGAGAGAGAAGTGATALATVFLLAAFLAATFLAGFVLLAFFLDCFRTAFLAMSLSSHWICCSAECFEMHVKAEQTSHASFILSRPTGMISAAKMERIQKDNRHSSGIFSPRALASSAARRLSRSFA